MKKIFFSILVLLSFAFVKATVFASGGEELEMSVVTYDVSEEEMEEKMSNVQNSRYVCKWYNIYNYTCNICSDNYILIKNTDGSLAFKFYKGDFFNKNGEKLASCDFDRKRYVKACNSRVIIDFGIHSMKDSEEYKACMDDLDVTEVEYEDLKLENTEIRGTMYGGDLLYARVEFREGISDDYRAIYNKYNSMIINFDKRIPDYIAAFMAYHECLY